eukprot:COSAG05_NODE_6990_length_870_cov_0.907912_1_plen_171_part_10
MTPARSMRKTRSAPAHAAGSMLREFDTDGSARRPPLVRWLSHNPERWLDEFNSYGNGTCRPDMDRIRAMRLLIQEQTFAVCEASQYYVPRMRTEPSDSSMEPTRATHVLEGVLPQASSLPGDLAALVKVQLDPAPARQTVLCFPGPETRASLPPSAGPPTSGATAAVEVAA